MVQALAHSSTARPTGRYPDRDPVKRFPQPYHSTETTVTDSGANVRMSEAPFTVTFKGFGDTTSGCSKELTLSMPGAVRVSPAALVTLSPFSNASTCNDWCGSKLVRAR